MEVSGSLAVLARSASRFSPTPLHPRHRFRLGPTRCRHLTHTSEPLSRALLARQRDGGEWETSSRSRTRSTWWKDSLRKFKLLRNSLKGAAVVVSGSINTSASNGIAEGDVKPDSASPEIPHDAKAQVVSLPQNSNAASAIPSEAPSNYAPPHAHDMTGVLRNALPLAAGSGYHACRHPVVLCHGLFGFDTRGPSSVPFLQVHYWNSIIVALRRLGCTVHAARVPRTGGVRSRALALHDLLMERVSGQGSEEVNLVAHSMGGLDCRFLITHLHRPNSSQSQTHPYRVRSLTTVATPHRGSSFMDYLHENFGLGRVHDTDYSRLLGVNGSYSPAPTQTRQSRQSPPSWLLGVLATLDRPGYSHLTTDFCTRFFNEHVTPDDPSVTYFSYASHLPTPPMSNPLHFSHAVISRREGANDGLVSVDSARWGKVVKVIEGVDHWDLNGRWRITGKREGWRVEDFWVEAVGRLWQEGY
ncbi:alpha/beta-hydrolase [Gonapodya prolifera JEL478]|uniref:Alpha/beta-hydrolase n=1 Tax=Gonapodya prolifera (strain JEL478) TaxID=1344416 RepID=A0A139AQV1_GONPJ|nr:alpha/beta-hydrolase [Gonapodya prolifera JEL478]|eukprot:KXS19131.1 alpha/beta-hydrolase [Gonapodya prolifera JEL478]